MISNIARKCFRRVGAVRPVRRAGTVVPRPFSVATRQPWQHRVSPVVIAEQPWRPRFMCTGMSEQDAHMVKKTLKDVPGIARDDTFVMLFTCNQCNTRAARQVSKVTRFRAQYVVAWESLTRDTLCAQAAYNHGSVLIRCPGCESLHLVADNLDWFKLGKVKLEDVLAARGEHVVDGNVFDLTPEDLSLLAQEANSDGPGPVGTPMPREPSE